MLNSPQNTAKEHRLKLLSYNVQVGIPANNFRHYLSNTWKHVLPFPGRQNNLDKIANFIKEFDIVGLLEMDSGSIRSEFVHQPEYVAEKAGFPFCYSKTNRDMGILAQHSLAILSRHEACYVKEHKLPSKIPGRGALEVHFGCESDKQPLVVVLAHLSLMQRAQRKQIAYLSELIKPYRHAVIMGDFNTQIHSRAFKHLFDNTSINKPPKTQHTFPSWRPRLGFDHIFATPEIKIGEAEVFGMDCSDHLPIGMEVGVPLHQLFNSGLPEVFTKT